jgi:hypothetical protein
MDSNKKIKLRKAMDKMCPSYFWEFSQNNSGGVYTVNEKICHTLYIEADSEDKAKEKAFDLGVYFDGVVSGIDCDCCGDRWSKYTSCVDLNCGNYAREDANKYAELYNANIKKKEGKVYKSANSEVEDCVLVFSNIIDYAQFMADKWGWTSPDARIFYKSGEIIEIYSEKVKKKKQ